jgi:hypothetical protein
MITKRKTENSQCGVDAVGAFRFTAHRRRPCLFRSNLIMPVLGVFLLFLILSPSASAQQTISFSDISIGPASADDFVSGQLYIQAEPIYWESDTPWRIFVRSVQPNLGVSDDGTYIKPLSDLMWKLSEDEVWNPMTQEENEIDFGSEPGEGVIYIDFLFSLDWMRDIAGDYGAEIVFTIQAVE